MVYILGVFIISVRGELKKMNNRRKKELTTFVVVIVLLCLLAACSTGQDNTKKTEAVIATASTDSKAASSAQEITLPVTTELQTEPVTTEAPVDISGVVFEEETLDGAKYSVPKGWRSGENEAGSKIYNADKPIGGYIYVFTTWSPKDYSSFSAEYDDSTLESLRSGWPDYTNTTRETLIDKDLQWVVDKSECSKTQLGDWRFTVRSDGEFHIGAIYPKNGDLIPRFLAIYEKVFESIDLSDFYVERPLMSLMDLEGDTVLVDNEYVKITFEGISYDTSYLAFQPVKVNLLIENKTESSIMVTINDFSVNGFMCNTYLYASLAGKKKTRDSIAFTDAELQSADISSPYEMEEMEWTFSVFNSDTYKTLGDFPAKLTIYK